MRRETDACDACGASLVRDRAVGWLWLELCAPCAHGLRALCRAPSPPPSSVGLAAWPAAALCLRLAGVPIAAVGAGFLTFLCLGAAPRRVRSARWVALVLLLSPWPSPTPLLAAPLAAFFGGLVGVLALLSPRALALRRRHPGTRARFWERLPGVDDHREVAAGESAQ